MKKCLFLILLTVASFFGAKASHVVGAEITYKHVTGDSFSVQLVVYRDCLGIRLYGSVIKVQSGCSTFNIPITNDTVIDVTGVGLNCSVKSPCASGGKPPYPYGFEKHVFSGGFIMPNDTCCNYLFSWGQCCRNVAITTGASAQNYYTETKYNKCLAPKNSSPAAILDPKLLVGVGEVQKISYQAIDIVDNDSVSYELSEPLRDSAKAIPYNTGFDLQKPLTFAGYPNFSLPAPLGFNLNASTGEIFFRPLIKNEVTVFAIKTIEWRKINGKYEKIGEVIRDVQMWVVTDSISDPVISKKQADIGLCTALGTHCQIIPITPGDPSDSITISYIANTPNITIKNIGTKASHPIAEVCIVVDSALLKSSIKPKFILKATSHSCPIQKIASKEFSFETKPQLPDSFGMKLSLTDCKNIKATFTNNTSLDSITPIWRIWNNNDTFNSVGDTLINRSFNDSGWVYATVKVFSPQYCNSREYKDSIYIGGDRFFKIALGKDRSFCFKQADTLQLSDTLLKGVTPYTYRWSTNNGDTNSTTIFSLPTGKRNIWVEVTDANGCISKDTLVISNYTPQVSITVPSKACANKAFGTTAIITNAINPTYSWVGFTNNNPFLVDTPSSSRSYQFILEDDFGCKIDTTISLTVLAPKVNITGKNNYCTYDTIKLESNTSGGQAPITTTWPLNGSIGNTLIINPKHSVGNISIVAKIKDGFGCENSASETITINALPVISLTPTGPYCEVDNNINLSTKATPKGGVWFGQNVINDSTFSPQTAQLGANTLSYSYKDPLTGCIDTSTTQIDIVRQEKASFIALKTIGSPNDTIAFINTTPNSSSLSNKWDMGDYGKPNNSQTTNNAIYSYKDTGKYTVKLWVKNSICPPDSIIKVAYIKITNVNLLSPNINSLNIKLYPNPANTSITIEADEEFANLIMFDITGKRINILANQRVNSTTTRIDISALPEGIYTIKGTLKSGDIFTQKITISH